MRNQKNQFIQHYANIICRDVRNEALKGAIKAATMHNKTYRNGVTNAQKNVFRIAWRREIVQLGEKYLTNEQISETFIQDVLTMKRYLNENYSDIFFNGGIRIGQCQKSLAIYLKWRWCYSDTMPAPPMCAIDRHILNHCRIRGNFTQLDNEEEYRQWVGKIINTATLESRTPIHGIMCHNVAEWELVTFNNLVVNR